VLLVYTPDFKDVVIHADTEHHIIIRPDPRQHPPKLQVAEGGSGWAFMLAAVAAITWAVAIRYFNKGASRQTA